MPWDLSIRPWLLLWRSAEKLITKARPFALLEKRSTEPSQAPGPGKGATAEFDSYMLGMLAQNRAEIKGRVPWLLGGTLAP